MDFFINIIMLQFDFLNHKIIEYKIVHYNFIFRSTYINFLNKTNLDNSNKKVFIK